jgi:PBSX family phage portal protein
MTNRRVVKATEGNPTEEESNEIAMYGPVIDDYRLGASHVSRETAGADPFNMPVEEIKTSVTGLTPVFKRQLSGQLKKVYRGVDAQSKKVEIDQISGYNAFQAVSPPLNLDYLARLYEVNDAHKAAVDAKTANIVGLGFKFTETTKTKRRLEDLEGDKEGLIKIRKKLSRAREDLVDLFDSFNEEDTFTEILIKVWKDYETTGNGYIEVGRKRDGTIGYVGHCPSLSIRIRQHRDGFVQIISNRVVFFRNFGNGNPRRSDVDKNPPIADPFGGDDNPNELIHFKKYSPTSGFYGIPDIIAAKNAVAGKEFASRFNLDYFENKAVPRHVITLKGARLGTATETALLQFFETGLKGQNHRSLYIPLPPDTADNKVELKIDPVEAGIQDSSFNNYDRGNTNSVLMVHRVPIGKVSSAEGASLAVARDADKTFKEQVCGPEQSIAEKKINRLTKEITDAFEIDLNEMSLTDADTQSKIDERDVKNQIKTPNEVRADRGLTGLKGGDKVVEIKPAVKADANATRARDSARSAGATDSAGAARNPKGEGRTTP